VARIRFLRDRIDMRMVRELTAACDHLEDDSPCRILVFEGAPAQGCFLRGIDFTDFRPDQPMDIHGFGKWERLCTRVERLKMATIAAIDGAAVGGGVQLALCCDARVATARATLQLDEVHHGFLPGMATWRLARFVGLGRAKRLVLQCPQVSAQDAREMGLIDEVGDAIGPLVDAAVAGFGPAHVVAIQLARRLLNESSSTAYEDAIGNFLAAQHRAISQSAFLDTVARAHKDGEPA
jgi:enoyl-CoA hydratase/carnithine racemase